MDQETAVDSLDESPERFGLVVGEPPAGLYRVKPTAQRMLLPLVGALAARGVRADVLTLAAVPTAALGGLCLALSDEWPALLLLVPALAGLRLVLNLLDGQVARRTATTHPLGELANELGDRVADVLFIGGLAFVAAVGPLLALAGAIAAILASYVGVTARAIGVPRQYGGLMSKPGRMIVLALAAPLALALRESWPLLLAAWLILGGSLVTMAQRIGATRGAVRAELRAEPPPEQGDQP
jgi:CDP-diacylglycerol---glycerol-3-phosphate 3-phosphatidyltransferase